jgi:hypothetical protein
VRNALIRGDGRRFSCAYRAVDTMAELLAEIELVSAESGQAKQRLRRGSRATSPTGFQ